MKFSLTKSWIVLLVFVALMFSSIGVTPAHAATFTVTNLNDSGAGSLRQAILAANVNAAAADTITFSVSGTITLASTLPNITDTAGLTMDGTGQTLTISGNNAVRVMQVDAGASLALNNLTIANGKGSGGGILNNGTATITNSTFSGNNAFGGTGAGFDNNGIASITNSTFSGNSTSGGFGGGVFNNGGPLTITNSTFSGGNSASGGFGAAIMNNNVASKVTLRNTIVANSVGAGNCSGGITNGGNNIDDGATCGWGVASGSMSSTNPLLRALANNGGPTRTFALRTGSPAIDGVTFSAPNSAPSTDQRGVTRPQDGDGNGSAIADIGAFEYQLGALKAVNLTPILMLLLD